MERPQLSPLGHAHKAQDLSPARALLTPTWLVALFVLILNDHLLKGAGVLPGMITGKLSDFAGMIVAPVLLAVLLRVRSRQALLACFVAVGTVFAGIQLSPAFAASWSALMGGIGFPWLITCDPTDLIALPTLALAWHLLVPEMKGELDYATPLRRSACAMLSLVGLWSTVATSPAEGPSALEEGFGTDSEGESVFANLAIANAGADELRLRVRPLRVELELDCDRVASDPARMLQSEAFADGLERELEPGELLAIQTTENVACTAVWVDGFGVAPVILFLDAPADFPQEQYGARPEDTGPGGMSLTVDASGSTWEGGETVRYSPEALPDPEAWGCALDPGEQRIDWQLPAHAINEVLALEPALDSSDEGCWSAQLQPLDAQGPAGEPFAWSVCVPDMALPFSIGERVELDAQAGSAGEEILRVTLLDENLAPALDDANRVIRRSHYMRGGPHYDYITPSINRELVAIPVVSCPWQAIPGCATVERPVELALADSAELLEPNMPAVLEDGGFTHTVVLARARERAVVDPGCVDAGATTLSYDLDIALIDQPAG